MTRDELIKLADEIPELNLSTEEYHKLCDSAPEVAKKKGLFDVQDGVVKYMAQARIVPTNTSITDKDKAFAKAVGNKAKKTLEDYKPTPEELVAINKLSNVDLSEDDVYVFMTLAMDNNPDRQYDIVSSKANSSAARMTADRPMLTDHEREVENIVGKLIEGTTYKGSLWQKFYIDSQNYTLARAIMLGLVNKVSVSFGASPVHAICSSCRDKSIYSMECPHYPGRKDENGDTVYCLLKNIDDYYETSFVAVPAQPRAGVRREPVEEMTMPELSAKSLTPEDVEATNAFMEEEDFTTDSNKNKTVDRIVTEKLDGENPVSDAEKNALAEELTTENPELTSVKSDEDSEAGADPVDAAPAEENKSEDESAEASVVKVFKEYLDVLKSLVETNNKVLGELTEAVKAQSEAIEKAITVDSEPAPEVIAAKSVRPEISAKGGLFAHLDAAFKQNESDQ